MTKIVVAGGLNFYPDQIERLNKLGDMIYYSDCASTHEEWLERVKDADIICSGKFGLLQKVYELNNKFITVPFVAVSWANIAKLKERNITLANAPGCNKYAVSEWIIGMMINLFRKLPELINTLKPNTTDTVISGLKDKEVCILGRGNIGNRVGTVCEALEMQVTYFKKGDNLKDKTTNADVIIDCLGQNSTTKNILNKDFFFSLKKGAFFITVTGTEIYDTDAIISALDNNILAGAAMDAGSIPIGDTKNPYYLKLQQHPKILSTPHIAFNTDVTARIANDIIIDNVESYLKGHPKNIIN
ncbi:MAG: NAD(P)-dependent oxidoreductase [Candidatus Woesearchaeota archaeon]|jgi:phosphoglycerate dehydrogenase-like enzyme